jgi:SOS response regulatory protein OraA/RecX
MKRFLISKGYDFDVVEKVLKKIFKKNSITDFDLSVF